MRAFRCWFGAFLFFSFFFLVAAKGGNNKPFVLVTGGAGYIGSQTCKVLYEGGYTPVVYDSLQLGRKEAVKWGPLIVADLNDRAALDHVLDEYQPIGVIHFAAIAAVGESVSNPAKYYRNNVVGSLTLLEAVKDHRIPVFIFSSSAATYGMPLQSIITELTPQVPINPYGNTKLITEMMLADFERAYGIRYVCFRYFNAAGADLEGELGPDVTRPTHLIPVIVQTAAKEKPRLEIFGSDFPTPDGTGIRDYVHVVDLARAHLLGLEYLLRGNPSVILNLGTGHGHSVKEVVETAQKVIPREIPFVYSGRRAGDPPVLIADFQKAREVLGWEPLHSDLETMIGGTWEWHERKN